MFMYAVQGWEKVLIRDLEEGSGMWRLSLCVVMLAVRCWKGADETFGDTQAQVRDCDM